MLGQAPWRRSIERWPRCAEPLSFAGLADILGAVFLLIAVLWMIQAFMQRAFNEFWWMSLISGILMVGIAFWVSGQYFLTRAATLLVFAGIWAAMKGVTDIVRAFAIRRLELLAGLRRFNAKGMTRRLVIPFDLPVHTANRRRVPQSARGGGPSRRLATLSASSATPSCSASGPPALAFRGRER